MLFGPVNVGGFLTQVPFSSHSMYNILLSQEPYGQEKSSLYSG
jgi:hypothetical protein